MAAADLQLPRTSWRAAYRLRLKRKQLLWRAFRARHQLTEIQNKTASLTRNDIVAVVVLRNEASRLPYFLEYYRKLGVAQFLVVDNGSDDGSFEYLRTQHDVSLWQTHHSYRASRFGLDWLTWLQRQYCHGRWCVLVDVDELLIYQGADQHGLPALTRKLDDQGQAGLGALMLDLYPKGALADREYRVGQDPLEILNWFDAAPYRAARQMPLGNLWVQGGMRERVFFADTPRRSPTLNKIPLLKWDRSYAYVNSTHSVLPRRLNALYYGPGTQESCGVLLHTKFLPEVVSKSETEQQRQQHFHTPTDFDGYYERIMASPDLWCEDSVQYEGDAQLVELGLMSKIHW